MRPPSMQVHRQLACWLPEVYGDIMDTIPIPVSLSAMPCTALVPCNWYQCVGETAFCVYEPQHAGQDPSFSYNI